MTTAYKIGFFSDTHIGYAAKVRTHAASGLNERVRDGMKALRETVTQMIDEEVDLVIQGGDIFHRSWPQIAEVVFTRRELERLTASGIPVVVNTGNHDASSERGKTAATAAIHDPERGIEAVIEPYRIVRPVDGLAIHALSHYGLARAERILPEPIEGEINILTAHGTALVPGHEIFACADSPGEQPIGLDLLTDERFSAALLGHYHGMGSLPNLPNAWYAGSSLRRGFSDPEGGRGWLLVEIDTNGAVTITPKFINQRPQFDLPVINAIGLTGEEVREQAKANLDMVDTSDAIIRQVITNITAQHRAGINLPALASEAKNALQWMPVLRRPEEQIIFFDEETNEMSETIVAAEDSLATVRSVDLPASYRTWVSGWSETSGVPESLRAPIAKQGEEHLQAVTHPDDAEDGNADLKVKG
jgi:DNA repair exonuclease SbcCD nuclease subunit